jgi:hypothetical protein
VHIAPSDVSARAYGADDTSKDGMTFMILETAAHITVSIQAGAKYAVKKGQSISTITVTQPRTLIWDRGAPIAFLHNGHNGNTPLHVPIERIMKRRYQPGRDPMFLTIPTNGHDLMEYLRGWIASLPTSER